LVVFLAFAVSPAIAKKPPWAGKEKTEKHQHQKVYKAGNGYFDERDREVVHRYFDEQSRAGHCPPGLAKKRNGCMPPGQAKKWSVGRPLPREVIYHEVPPEVLVELGPAPPKHRYVRVAKDILLVAVGTGMIVDAIEDLDEVL